MCKAEISEPQQPLSMKNSLYILHQLLLAADYETFFVLNYEDSLNYLVN